MTPKEKAKKGGALTVPDARSEVVDAKPLDASRSEPQFEVALMSQTLQMLALPAPGTLAEYNAVNPELGKWFMTAADDERAHRHTLETCQKDNATAIISARVWRVKWGLAAGFFIAALGVSGVTWALIVRGAHWGYFGIGTMMALTVAALARVDSPTPVAQSPKQLPSSAPKK